MPRSLRLLGFGLLLLLSSASLQAQEFFFKPQDRIVFLGDSITEQYQYSTDIELYLTTRFPEWNLTFINAGISGDTATGGAGRFAAHVLAEKPTAVTINFGMNDAGYKEFNPGANANYVKNTEAMLAAAKQAGVRVALLSPNAVDRRVNESFYRYLETQKRFYKPLRELAEKYQDRFVDQYAVTRAALQKMEEDEATAVRPFGDGFHTDSPGGLFMAHAILVGLNAPALVSQVDIDVSSKAAKPTACKVDQLKADAAGVEFQRTDDALPIPVQNEWVSLLPYVNNLKDLNWYGLKVAGLTAGKYALSIDGMEVATYTSEQLTEGVNLGLLTSGPIHAQGQKALAAINAKNQVVHQRFRSVLMFNPPDWLADVAAERKAKEMAARTAKIAEMQAEVYKLVKPVPHQFVLKGAK